MNRIEFYRVNGPPLTKRSQTLLAGTIPTDEEFRAAWQDAGQFIDSVLEDAVKGSEPYADWIGFRVLAENGTVLYSQQANRRLYPELVLQTIRA